MAKAFLNLDFNAFAIRLDPRVRVGLRKHRGRLGRIICTCIGPYGVPILALSTGFIVFDFAKVAKFRGGKVEGEREERKWKNINQIQKSKRGELRTERIKYMNAFLMCSENLFDSNEDGPLNPLQGVVNSHTYCEFNHVSDGWINIDDDGINAPESDKYIRIQDFQNIAETMNIYYKVFGEKFSEMLELLLIGVRQYSDQMFSSSHMASWTVVEYLINRKWNEYLDRSSTKNGGFTDITKDRMKQLTGITYTASIKTQILSLLRIYDDETLARLNEARSRRNDFVHKMKKISSNDAAAVMFLAFTLLAKESGHRFGHSLLYLSRP